MTPIARHSGEELKHETAYLESRQADPQGNAVLDQDEALHPDHPMNFSPWKKRGIMVALAWSGFLANYGASAHLTAFLKMSITFGVTPVDVANTIGYGLLGIAVGPIFWNPLSKTIGRRYTYLLGSILYLPCVVWCALSKSYSVFVAARICAGLASAFSQTVPPATIADIYPKQVRGSKLSTYGVAVIIAPAFSPLICSLVVNDHDWPLIYWIVLAFGGIQFLLFFFLVPETLWTEIDDVHADTDNMQVHDVTRNGRRGPAWMPWQHPKEFGHMILMPITMLRFLPILIPSFYYGTLFAWSVGLTIVGPQLFEAPPYNFKPIPTGCTYLAYGLGAILGKWSGGTVGDIIVTRFSHRQGGIRKPEYRLWALVPILPFFFIGLFIFGITFEKQKHWMGPLVGGALAYYCLAASTGILQTYVLETYLTRSMDTQAIFIFFKAIAGFAVSYFAIQWEVESSLIEEYSVEGALATGLGVIICGVFIWKGEAIRQAQGMPMIDSTTVVVSKP